MNDGPTSVTVPRFWNLVGDGEPDDADLAEDYHESSKFYRSTIGRMVRPDRIAATAQISASVQIGARELPHLPLLDLPEISGYGNDVALERDMSCRDFADRNLSSEAIGRLLWMSYGAVDSFHPQTGAPRRPVPSGGALYPLELYLLADIRDQGKRGVYHYNVTRHALEEIRDEVDPETLRRLGQPEELLRQAPVTMLIMGLFWRSRYKYGARGYRFTLIEAGQVIQQSLLAAKSLGLSAVPFAGIFDDAVEDLCEVDGVDESFINAVLFGYGGH